MIIGTIALLTILFGGGTGELFFVDQLEKGIKEFVMDKDRQKDILSDLKTSKAFIKEYNKDREVDLKYFYDINSSWYTTSDDLVMYFDKMQKKRIAFQNTMIANRIGITEKITFDEWVYILQYSNISTDKRIAEEQENAEKLEEKDKSPVVFENTRNAIKENVSDEEKQSKILDGLDDMILTFEELGNEISSMNVKGNNILVRKDASKEELKEMVEEMNVLRNLSFNQLLNFHMLVKENTVKMEWESIMKTFNKELTITDK